MVIQDLESILCYNYTYPVEEYSMAQFRKRKNKSLTYFEVLQELVTTHILTGVRKYGEFEVEWFTLKRLLQEQLTEYHHTNYFPTCNLHILLDQALILEFEGHHIPNLLR